MGVSFCRSSLRFLDVLGLDEEFGVQVDVGLSYLISMMVIILAGPVNRVLQSCIVAWVHASKCILGPAPNWLSCSKGG